jgi:hypothetical protein
MGLAAALDLLQSGKDSRLMDLDQRRLGQLSDTQPARRELLKYNAGNNRLGHTLLILIQYGLGLTLSAEASWQSSLPSRSAWSMMASKDNRTIA